MKVFDKTEIEEILDEIKVESIKRKVTDVVSDLYKEEREDAAKDAAKWAREFDKRVREKYAGKITDLNKSDPSIDDVISLSEEIGQCIKDAFDEKFCGLCYLEAQGVFDTLDPHPDFKEDPDLRCDAFGFIVERHSYCTAHSFGWRIEDGKVIGNIAGRKPKMG